MANGRFSSRRERLDKVFLSQRLRDALKYDRISGYFTSSLVELMAEELESVRGEIRVVCNSAVRRDDVITARAAVGSQWKEWTPSIDPRLNAEPDLVSALPHEEFSRMYRLLESGKLRVKVLPDDAFGLIHGKAGVITLANGKPTSFIGSANDTRSAWQSNYELIWEDDSQESVAWTQAEFDALWNHADARDLAEMVKVDIGRLGRRRVILLEDWARQPTPAPTTIESAVFRKELGLWQHQKFFIEKAFKAHIGPQGKARFVLADQVGLGKTVQLAITAQLMALVGDLPVLVLAPKSLVWQWQDELHHLLDLPSAVWDGKRWVDEDGAEGANIGVEGIRKCLRKIGIISTGLINRPGEVSEILAGMKYECVILDEAHRARRKNLGANRDNEKADPNNLLRFMKRIAARSRSVLLATATPVQLRPIEAYDLLAVLAEGDDSVLGNNQSRWRQDPSVGLEIIMGRARPPSEVTESWAWMCNPIPRQLGTQQVDAFGRNFPQVLTFLEVDEQKTALRGADYDALNPPNKQRVKLMGKDFFDFYNPYIQRIVRRTRKQLEEAIDPETNQPYLTPIGVSLFGEGEREGIHLPAYLHTAYEHAERFCALVGKRQRGSGFLKTLVLRRMGSSLLAGMNTARKLLGEPIEGLDDRTEDEEDDNEETPTIEMSEFGKSLVEEERKELRLMLRNMAEYRERDPKFEQVKRYLLDESWLMDGCIVFSQYRDSLIGLMDYLAEQLPNEVIGLYSGAASSVVRRNGVTRRETRENIKRMVRDGEIRLLLGTDAASEGLNLQRLGTLINLDLPWNPTRLEQRKGRIQRIGQRLNSVKIYNMRYSGSVEDRVHELLSDRLKEISDLFGQLPDVLEDVWINTALGDMEAAQQVINQVPQTHPFEVRNSAVEGVDWESCAEVLSAREKREALSKGWVRG